MTDDEIAWVYSLSDDPYCPSTITIAYEDEINVFGTTMRVMPGEVLQCYRVDGGVVFTNFPGVTIH